MTRENEILQFLHFHPGSSRVEIETGMNLSESPATVKRILASLVEAGSAVVSGQGRATRYSVSPQAHVTMELKIDSYFQKETDEREIQTTFNFELINDILPKVELFTKELAVDKGIRKRRVGITGNAILIANKYCPISFRTVDSVDYKKAMLIFYEQNNISAFKKIFIDQFAFAVQTYF